jgi:hypothetical protein
MALCFTENGAGCKAHMNFSGQSACLMANNIWNEGK